MIVVRVMGGLGNQLFQYAAGRALALRTGVELGLDYSFFDHHALRRYELDAFALDAAPIAGVRLPPTSRGLAGRIAKLFVRSPLLHFRERQFHFDPAVLSLPDCSYLDGYFQSEKYFADSAAAVRRELTLKLPLSPANQQILGRIRAAPAVSLHIRRGDYANDPRIQRLIGTVGLDYYQAAAAHVAKAAGTRPTLFVFSDEPDWAKAHLRLPYDVDFVEGIEDSRPSEHLALMAACRHHIIANSSFSWWGAWLNPSPDKIVVGPAHWFNNPRHDTSTLLPDNWVRL